MKGEGIMQPQQIAKGELLGEFRGKAVSTTIKEVTPFGMRLEQNIQGEFVGAKYSARQTQTTDLFQRIDGTYEYETKIFEQTNEGDFVLAVTHGTGKMTGPTTHKGEGEIVHMAQSPKFAWLNNLKCRVEMTGDASTGEISGKVFTL